MNKWYVHSPESLLENETHKFIRDFEIQTDHLISTRQLDLIMIKKGNLQICKLCCPGWPQSKIERDTKTMICTSTLVRNGKKIWNMKVTIISIVISGLSTVPEGLIKGVKDLEITGRVETVQANVILRSARILRRVLETWRDLLSLKLQWKTISVSWCKKNSRNNNNNNRLSTPILTDNIFLCGICDTFCLSCRLFRGCLVWFDFFV